MLYIHIYSQRVPACVGARAILRGGGRKKKKLRRESATGGGCSRGLQAAAVGAREEKDDAADGGGRGGGRGEGRLAVDEVLWSTRCCVRVLGIMCVCGGGGAEKSRCEGGGGRG